MNFNIPTLFYAAGRRAFQKEKSEGRESLIFVSLKRERLYHLRVREQALDMTKHMDTPTAGNAISHSGRLLSNQLASRRHDISSACDWAHCSSNMAQLGLVMQRSPGFGSRTRETNARCEQKWKLRTVRGLVYC